MNQVEQSVTEYVDEVWEDVVADIEQLVNYPSVAVAADAEPGAPFGRPVRDALDCALGIAQKLGYRTVFWSLAYVDWYQDNQPTDEQAFSKLLPRIHPGAVVLLHSTSQTNARILDTLLSKWEEMGYSFGTLDELFA